MKADSWMPVYVGDYLRDTMHLTTEQHGAYLLLLFCCWFARGLLDDNDSYLAAVCRSTPEHWKTNLRPVLVKFFEVKDGKWISKRVAEERLKADKLCEFRQEIGRKGGIAKAANAIANASGLLYQNTKQNPTPSPSPSPIKTVVSGIPTVEQCLAWLADTKKNGADYTEAETRGAFLALSAGGWQWGNRPIADWRCGLERQIQTDRQRKPHGNNSKNRPQIDRNAGTCGESAEDYGKKIAECVARRQAESAARLDALAAQVAET